MSKLGRKSRVFNIFKEILKNYCREKITMLYWKCFFISTMFVSFSIVCWNTLTVKEREDKYAVS